MRKPVQGYTVMHIAKQADAEMKKSQRSEATAGKALPDRAVGMDELSQITGLSKWALYHLRSHRPSALPPPLVGDAYRNSAKYLLSTVQEWLIEQQARPAVGPTPTQESTPTPAPTSPTGAAGATPTPPTEPARPGRPRKQSK